MPFPFDLPGQEELGLPARLKPVQTLSFYIMQSKGQETQTKETESQPFDHVTEGIPKTHLRTFLTPTDCTFSD